MPSYEHNRLVERVARLDDPPGDAADYAAWIEAGRHLQMLRDNARSDELVIYASGEHTFVHAVVVSEEDVSSLEKSDLLQWSGGPYSTCASYVTGGGNDSVWIERDQYDRGAKTLRQARPLVYFRDFEGLKEPDSAYFEVTQEYAHLAGIHRRPERSAYCRFDGRGDWQDVVSFTSKERSQQINLVSFRRDQLEQYLATSTSVLVRTFDFMLLRYSEFTEWPKGPETIVDGSDELFYRQKVDPGKAAYTRGVQIVRPSRPKAEILASITNSWGWRDDGQYCEFIAWDWRNRRIASISSDPSATTSYYESSENSLPFEVSPAFFRPEVLSKYKSDRDKYTIDEEFRSISCRGSWHLKTYDINEAGQVHTYLCYLRDLPYEEQLYWLSFNEDPKAGISERALVNDYRGEPYDTIDPITKIRLIVRRWADSGLDWWKLRDSTLLDRINLPVTDSRDEWGQAYSDLAKLVVEGFRVRAIRQKLRKEGIDFTKDEQSLTLIEKLLAGRHDVSQVSRLHGLRRVQLIRSKVASHVGGGDALQLARETLSDHGTFKADFESTCNVVADELNLIDNELS